MEMILLKSIIEQSCDELYNFLNDRRTKEQMFKDCAREKLITIYDKENKEYDMLLDKLEVCVECNDVTQLKRCIEKITRLLSSNRKALMRNIRKVL